MKNLLLPLLSVLGLAACVRPDTTVANAASSDCGVLIQVRDPMPRLTSDFFQVVAATVEDRCLSVTISATGCSSDAWRVALHTDGRVAESSPTQTQALLVLDDGVEEDGVTCQMIIEETYTFDLQPYLTDAVLPTSFSLTGTDTVLEVTGE